MRCLVTGSGVGAGEAVACAVGLAVGCSVGAQATHPNKTVVRSKIITVFNPLFMAGSFMEYFNVILIIPNRAQKGNLFIIDFLTKKDVFSTSFLVLFFASDFVSFFAISIII